MTGAQLRALRLSVLETTVTDLFANGDGTVAQKGWNDPFDSEDGSRSINWSEGIPPDYAMPYENEGKKILRKDVNAVGNLATRELYLLEHGGYHTFDSSVAEAIGGYPYGAFLDWYQPSTGWMRKVRCVKEGGNCFTPIDDPDHGVDSSDKYWEIADYLDDASQTSAGNVETKTATVPDGMLVAYGGFGVEIPYGTVIAPGQTAKSDPWTAPYDAMVEIPVFINPSYVSALDSSNLKNPDVLVYAYPASGVQENYGFEESVFLEVSDEGGVLNMDLIPWVVPLNTSASSSKVQTRGYTLCKRMFIKKGTSLRLCYSNMQTGTGATSVQVGRALLMFNPSEVS